MTGFWRTVLRICALFFCLCSSAIAARNDIIILLANSESMRYSDPGSLTTRALGGYLQDISGDTRVAVLSFAEYVLQIHPFTSIESAAISPLLERIRIIIPEGGHSNSAAGMERSIYELKTRGRPDADKAIILITDTYIHTGDQSRDRDFERWFREILAQEAATAQIRVFGIALGGQADIQNLQTMAFETGGDYYRASDASEIRTLLTRIHENITGVEVPPAPSIATEPVYSPDSASSPAEFSAYSDSGHRTIQRSLAGSDEGAESFVLDQEPVSSPVFSAPPQQPETEIGVHSTAGETDRTERSGWQWPTASSMLLPILAASVVLLGIAAYLMLRTRKRRGSTRTHPGDRGSPYVFEDVNEITDQKNYDISETSVSGSASKGDTEELLPDNCALRDTRKPIANQPDVTTPSPKKWAASATDELNAAKEDTEELPRIELEETVVKSSEQDPKIIFKPGEKSELPGTAQEEEDDETRLLPKN